MSETDSPEIGSGNDTALTVDQGAAAIEGLLSNVPDDADEAGQDSGQNEESNAKGLETAPAGDDPDEVELDLEPDDETPEAETNAPDEPKYKSGQFAANDAKVKLDDGTTISVADLIAGNMFQRTFTEKTTALSQEKKALEAERSQFAETQRQIEQQRAVILTLAQELLPQEPQPVDPNEDPGGYLEYLASRDTYFGKMQRLQYLWNSNQQEQVQLTERQKQEQAEQQRRQSEDYAKAIEAEKVKLHSALPKLKDDKERAKFVQDVVKIGQSEYGITPEEINGIVDHRYMRILADAIAFRKAVAKAKAPTQPVTPAQAQQPRIQQKQRMAPTSPETRDSNAANDRLRKTGSREDAVKALMKFV